MSANNKKTGGSSSSMGGCGVLASVILSVFAMGASGNIDNAPGIIALIIVFFLGLLLVVAWIWDSLEEQVKKRIVKLEYKRREKEYAKLLAEFKQDGMNEAVYEKIMLLFSGGSKTLQINAATATPEELHRFNEVVSVRYYAILDRLHRADSSALRSELLKTGRFLNELNPSNGEWSELRLANDLATLLPATVHASSSVNVATQLAELDKLCKRGIITQAEFKRGKALFLGNPPDVAAQTLNVLDSLHKLKMNGALSESEYNIKKWELLGGKNLNPK